MYLVEEWLEFQKESLLRVLEVQGAVVYLVLVPPLEGELLL